MRQPFSDLRRLKRAAKRNHQNGTAAMRRWWVNKYKLPPSHELFRSQSTAELTVEMYEDLHFRKAELEGELREATDGRDRLRLMDALQHVEDIITDGDLPKDGVVRTGDPLVDKWEREIAAGRVPDLDEVAA